MLMETTADLPNQTTSMELNNANSPGNAEVPEPAREEDGAQDMMDALTPLSQCKPQVLFLIAET